MAAKRALVVDDSKSARVVLSRMLEKYGIEVDAADSAESALDYLQSNRPDVIFMDHLMPGMDGLQAVRAIKANPETATIPVMMYTSQEGELYAGQARASGAIGVLPKSIRPIDVTKALYQLQMLPDRRDAAPPVLQPWGTDASPRDGEPAPAADGVDPKLRGLVEAMLKEQSLELRRFVVASLDSQVHRIVAELRPKEPADAGEQQPAALPLAPSRPWGWMLTAASALAALAVVALLYWQAREATAQAQRAFEAAAASNEALTRAIEEWRRAGSDVAVLAAATEPESPRPMVLPVPYGEAPLAATRLEALRNLVMQLERTGISGLVRVETFSGSFCLSGGGEAGWQPAAPTTPASQCEQIGNPYDDSVGGAARQPLTFANLAATVRRRTGGAIELELAQGPRDRLASGYPAIEQATAGQWNAAALANNRVEISVLQR